MSTCLICKNSCQVILKSTCDHTICSCCFHKEILYNFNSLLSIQSLDEEINYKCLICDLGNFPYPLKEVTELLKSASPQKPEPVSDECLEHNKKYKLFCKTCKLKMCHVCLGDHPDNHELTTKIADSNLVQNKCSKHDEKLKLQCTDCNTPICLICRETNHLNHKSVYIFEFYENIKINLEKNKFPYGTNFEEFKEIFKDDKEKVIENLHSKAMHIDNQISKIITSLCDLQSLLKENVKKVEEDFLIYSDLINIVFEKYSNDLKTIQAKQYELLHYLNKLPKFYGKFFFNQAIDENQNIVIKNINDGMLKLKQEINKTEFIHVIKHKDLTAPVEYKCIQSHTGHTNSVSSLTQSQNGLLASGSYDETIKLWDPQQGYKCIQTLIGHTNSVLSLTQLQNGLLASGSCDKSIKFWIV